MKDLDFVFLFYLEFVSVLRIELYLVFFVFRYFVLGLVLSRGY